MVHGARVFGIIIHGVQFARTEVIDDTGDGTAFGVELAEIALEALDLVTDSEHGDEVSAGGGAPHGNFFRVEVVFCGVAAQPAEGGLAVVDLGRPVGFVCEAIADTGGGIFSTFDDGQETPSRAVLGTVSPSAAVNEHEEGEGVAGAVFGKVEVECLARVVGFGVGDILFYLDRIGKARGRALGEGLRGKDGDEGKEIEEEAFHGDRNKRGGLRFVATGFWNRAGNHGALWNWSDWTRPERQRHCQSAERIASS